MVAVGTLADIGTAPS